MTGNIAADVENVIATTCAADAQERLMSCVPMLAEAVENWRCGPDTAPPGSITKEDKQAALAHLAECFPQTFVLEKYLPHRPLKIGICPDILARCPVLTRRELGTVLGVYASRRGSSQHAAWWCCVSHQRLA
jgi:hypothetical protein